MTDIDIVAELRRLYKAVPQGEWALEPYAGFTSWWMGYDIRIGPNTGDVIVGADRALLGYDEREIGDLIVAMHEALPALLDVVEAAEGYRDYSIHSIEGMEYERRLDAALDALAALKRSGEG